MGSQIAHNPAAYGLAVAAVVVGLVGLLVGEYVGATATLVPAGGVAALAGVSALTALVAKLPAREGEGAAESGH